jgi:hypothetical protein
VSSRSQTVVVPKKDERFLVSRVYECAVLIDGIVTMEVVSEKIRVWFWLGAK